MEEKAIITKEFRSPSWKKKNLAVEFAVLHYTAQSLKSSLEIFLSRSRGLSCHLLIDRLGKIYELVSCWDGVCLQAFHAGKSHYLDSKGKYWEAFNQFSIGVELVNWNGNIFPFHKKQYESLFTALTHLKKLYPALQDPERILGHEHIAGFRGKADPGRMFDWDLLYKAVYPSRPLSPQALYCRSSSLSQKRQKALGFLKKPSAWNDKKARQISLLMEKPKLPFWLKKVLFYLLFKWPFLPFRS